MATINVCFLEDLKLFYNKYLNIGLSDRYFDDLINRYFSIWCSKYVDTTNLNAISKASFSEKDYSKLLKNDREFLNFIPFTCVKGGEYYDIVIDSFGNISKFVFNAKSDISERQILQQYINQSIYSLLANFPDTLEKQEMLVEVENAILQNVLVSKIFKAVYEKIVFERNLVDASIFALANAKIFSYEDSLQEFINYEDLFRTKLVNSLSRRSVKKSILI